MGTTVQVKVSLARGENRKKARDAMDKALGEFARADNGVYTWRFDELGAGERRSIKVTYRVKPGIAVGTNMQLKNLLNYQDQLGNRY